MIIIIFIISIICNHQLLVIQGFYAQLHIEG